MFQEGTIEAQKKKNKNKKTKRKKEKKKTFLCFRREHGKP